MTFLFPPRRQELRPLVPVLLRVAPIPLIRVGREKTPFCLAQRGGVVLGSPSLQRIDLNAPLRPKVQSASSKLFAAINPAQRSVPVFSLDPRRGADLNKFPALYPVFWPAPVPARSSSMLPSPLPRPFFLPRKTMRSRKNVFTRFVFHTLKSAVAFFH